MAPFNLGQVGGLLQKLPEAAGNFFLPGIGPVAKKYSDPKVLQQALKPPSLRDAAQGTGTALSMGGMFIPDARARYAAVGIGTALNAAAPFLPGGATDQASTSKSTAQAGERPIGTQAVLNGRPVYWQGKDFGWQQATGGGTSDTLTALNAPGVQNRFIQDRAPGGAPQDRAYREAAINTAQQTAQNPLFQKYQVADLTKQYNTASSPAEKQRIGLEIWAQTNPLLAAKLKSGQLGYAQAQAAPGLSNAGNTALGGLPMPTTNFDITSSVTTPPTMEQTFGSFIPGAGMVSATPQNFNYTAGQPALSQGMLQSSYQAQLFSSPDFVAAAKNAPFIRSAYQQQGLK